MPSSGLAHRNERLSLGVGTLLALVLVDKETGLDQKQCHGSDTALYSMQCLLSSHQLEVIAEF